MQETVINAPILSYPLLNGKLLFDTDASNVGLGAVLSQIQEGQEKVFGYFRKSLSKPERGGSCWLLSKEYNTSTSTYMAEGFFSEQIMPLLNGFYISKIPRVKWHDGSRGFKIEHRAETSYKNADALSRRPCPDDCSHCGRAEEKESTICRTTAVDDNWSDNKIQRDQEEDPDLTLVIG